MTHFIVAYHISLVKVQTNYCNNNPLTLDVKHLNKIIKFYYLRTLNALWNGQGNIKMYYGMSRVEKQLSGKRSIAVYFTPNVFWSNWLILKFIKFINLNIETVRNFELVTFLYMSKRKILNIFAFGQMICW